jgi:mxaA protein
MISRLPATCLFMLLAPLAFAQASFNPVKSIRMVTPRAYGYVIGDVIHLQADLEIAKNHILDNNALPKPGPINRWLNLRQIHTAHESGPSVDHYRIELEYQIFFAPQIVRNLTIPTLELKFTGADGGTGVSLPTWNFSISPLHEHGIVSESGLPVLRPDAEPGVPQTAADWLLFWLSAITALLAMGYLAYIKIVLVYWVRGKHFADAGKTLRRMEQSSLSRTQMRSAFVCLHQAFNISNQAPLFAEGLNGFFSRYPHFLPLRRDIEDFYQASYGLFFGDDTQLTTKFPLERIVKLCQDCLSIERAQR